MGTLVNSGTYIKGLQTTLSSFEDISTIFRKLEAQGNIEKLANLINQIYEQEHDFTINELNRYAQDSNIQDNDFFEEQYELNSSIFRKNFALIAHSMIEEMGRALVQRFKNNLKSQNDNDPKNPIPNGRNSDLNFGILPSIQEENENDKTSLQSGRKEDDNQSQKVGSAQKELPVHPSLDMDNAGGSPDTIDIIEEYATGPVIIEEKITFSNKPIAEELPLRMDKKEQKLVENNFKAPPTHGINDAISRYGTTPHKELKINEMLAQRGKYQEAIKQVGRPTHERVKTQTLEVVTEPDYLRTNTSEDLPEREQRRTVQSTTNKSSGSFNYTPSNRDAKFEISIDQTKPNSVRPKSSERQPNFKNLNTSTSEPAKSPKSDKIRELRGTSPSNTSMSRASVLSNTNYPDPSILDSEFSYGKGMSFSRSKRKIHDDPQVAPGPGSYRTEDSNPSKIKKAPTQSFAKSPKHTIFETIKTESPGHIYYPSKHYVTK